MYRHGLCRVLTMLNLSTQREKCTSIALSLFIRLPLDLIVGQFDIYPSNDASASSFAQDGCKEVLETITKEVFMFLQSSNAEVSMQAQSSSSENNTWRGLLIGFVPLALLVVMAVIALIRQLFDPSGFFVVRQAALITLIAGLVIALVIFVVAIVLTLRRVAAWQRIGATKSSRAALWSLGITAFIVLLPVLLAIVL